MSVATTPTIASLAALVAPEPNSVVYYGRDYTNGGMAVSLADGGTEWQPYCGCTRVGFRTAPGLSERVIYRELFTAGLTLLDKGHLGDMATSHLVARQELRSLVKALNLPPVERRDEVGEAA